MAKGSSKESSSSSKRRKSKKSPIERSGSTVDNLRPKSQKSKTSKDGSQKTPSSQISRHGISDNRGYSSKNFDSSKKKTGSTEAVHSTAGDGLIVNEDRAPYSSNQKDNDGKSQGSTDGSVDSMPSAWDACTREAVNLDSLQLDVAHKVPPDFIPTRKLGPKNPRWYNDKAAPLTDPDKLPKGWTADEPDLDPRDIDGQIDRCRERIAANIVPSIFWQRLAEYQEAKEAEIALESRYPNFSKDVRIRLDHLYSIAKDIEIHGSGDSESPSRNVKNTQLPNIRAVIDAYYARKLEWTPGLVTYWSRGKQLCEPRQYNWDEFEAIYKKHNGHESFWVEGAATPGPMSVLRSIQLDNGPYLSNTYKIAIQVPGIKWWAELEFMLDTGSPMMTLYEGDIKTIMGPFTAPLPPTTRSLMISTSTNDIVRREVIELEVTILDKKKERVVPWWRIEATMEPGNWNPAPDQCRTRLDGAWVRYLMYMTSAPDGNLSTYLSTDMHSLLMDVPEVDPKTRKGLLQADLYTTSPKPSPLTNVRDREGRSRTSSDPTTETAWQPRVAPDVYIPLITPWRD